MMTLGSKVPSSEAKLLVSCTDTVGLQILPVKMVVVDEAAVQNDAVVRCKERQGRWPLATAFAHTVMVRLVLPSLP